MKHTKSSISRGVLHMIIASFSFGTMTAFVKYASETLPIFEVVFVRSFFGAVMIACMVIKEKASFVGKNPKLLLLRGILGFTALCMNFYAISKLNVGMAVMLNSTAPIFVAMMAPSILKEKISKLLWGLTILCFVGVYFLIGPQLSMKAFPIMVGILSGAMAAAAYVSIRYAVEEESPYTIIFYFTVISTIGSAPLLRYGFHIPNPQEWFGIFGIAIASFFGQIFLTKSIAKAPASVVSPFTYLTPVCSFLYGYFLWGDALTPRALFGTFLIIISGILIYLLQQKPAPIEE